MHTPLPAGLVPALLALNASLAWSQPGTSAWNAQLENRLVRGSVVRDEAIVAKPEDGRCCPSGRARVSIDTGTLRVRYQAQGFAHHLPDRVGRAIKP